MAFIHCILQLHLIGLINVDAQDYILSAYEVELGGLVLESGDPQHIPNSIAIKSYTIEFLDEKKCK